MITKLKVKYVNQDKIGHNWEVFKKNASVGFLHICKDSSFGGWFPKADICDDSVWSDLHEQCISDLADIYLLDRMEKQGY